MEATADMLEDAVFEIPLEVKQQIYNCLIGMTQVEREYFWNQLLAYFSGSIDLYHPSNQ